jgi:plasmid stability protein
LENIDINDLKGRIRMAGSLHVRNLDDELIAKLKRRAARHGRSTEAEHREILRQALATEVEPSFETLAAELRVLTRDRKQTPSEILLREGRDERRRWSATPALPSNGLSKSPARPTLSRCASKGS